MGAAWLRPMELMGSTEMPRSSMRNENSLVPWAEPRYLTMRRRRVAVSSLTRWLKTTTKSATYSSRPWRVIDLSPLSPVTIAVTPLSASHWKSRLTSARMMIWSLKAEKRTSMVSSTTRFAPMASISAPRRTNRPSRS